MKESSRMVLSVKFTSQNGADGIYRVQAKGYLVAILRWANAQGALPEWTAFGFATLNPSGEGYFRFCGGRAIPVDATHVAAELIASESKMRELLFVELPPERVTQTILPSVCFVVASDFHLSTKSERVRRALRLAKNADCVLLPGDLTNDGTPEQLELFRKCVEEELPRIPVLTVAGNHDYPTKPLPLVYERVESYCCLQTWLLDRAAQLGVYCKENVCGAYSASLKGVDIIGLNAVSHWRRFVFPGGAQIKWLESHLNSVPNTRHIVLCHAPLIDHCPGKNQDDVPYLSRDCSLQQIVNSNRSVIFLSGHTHLSLNDAKGCIIFDATQDNLYINDSSVAPTMLKTFEILADREWVDGAVIRLSIGEASVELLSYSVSSGKKIARGYYRFTTKCIGANTC